jgi:hypothetical protein
VRKIRVCVFKFDLMVSRARRDQDIRSGHRDTDGTGAPREIEGGAPNCMVDAEFRQQPFEILEYLLIAIAACTIP